MTQQQESVELKERIHHIETRLLPEAGLWSERTHAATLAERMAFYRIPGVSIAIINEGKIEWARGYGVTEAGTTKIVTPETIFQVCSISKHVAMVGALRLVQKGVLDLDENVNRYLVSWKIPANGDWQPQVTLRQLLAHTAGLSYNWFRGFREGEPPPTLTEVLAGQPPANTPPVRVVMLPGTQFRYSGSHYAALQQLLIDATGTPFPQLMRELVFEPLEMRNSSYDQSYPDTRPDSTAVGHYIGGEPVYGKWRVIPEMAGAGLWTTASDLARLACEIQHAHQGKPTAFLKQETADQALTPQVSKTFGLGMELHGKGATRMFGHGGSNIGYQCLTLAYANLGMGMVVLTNSDDGGEIVAELLHTIAEEYTWPDYLPNHTRATMQPQSYDVFVGQYELRPGFTLTISREGETLFLEASGQPRMILEPSSENTFFTRALNSEISFTKGKAGGAIKIVLKQEEQERSGKKIR